MISAKLTDLNLKEEIKDIIYVKMLLTRIKAKLAPLIVANKEVDNILMILSLKL